MFGIRQTLAAAAGILLLVGTAQAADVFTISSPAFKDGALAFKDGALLAKKMPATTKAIRTALAKTCHRRLNGAMYRPAQPALPS
jgi:hypothetical protein